jgi:hypothetical protein
MSIPTSQQVLRPRPGTEGGDSWLGIPSGVWTRLLLLAGCLVLIKIWLLAGLGKHLYEIHWRVEPVDITWVNYAAFGVLMLLGALSLGSLARQTSAAGVKAVRTANATVLALGLALILLTFHSGENNYLYPILTGVLRWTSLGPYLSLDFFFRPPFLAAWLLGYALVYYLLARQGREVWMLYVTACVAAVYAPLCLHELIQYRHELLMADCLGLVAVWSAQRHKGEMRLAWLWLPAAWIGLFSYELFRLNGPLPKESLIYLFGLLLGSAGLCFLSFRVAGRYGYAPVWSRLAPFYFGSLVLLANNHYPMAENFNHLFCVAAEVPRYFAGELAVAGGLGLLAAFVCRRWPNARLWWLDAVNLLLIALTFLDLRLSQIMGVRLEWNVLHFGNSPKMMWRMAQPYLAGVLAALAAAVVLYVVALRTLRAAHQRTRSWTGRGPTLAGLAYTAGLFLVLGALGFFLTSPDKARGQAGLKLAGSNPLWQRVTHHTLTPSEFVAHAEALGLGDFTRATHPLPAGPPRDLNVLLVFMESTYNKHLSLFNGQEETQPLLSHYKDRMEVFPNYFCNYAGSIQARFAAFTGLYPVRDFNEFTLRRVNVESIFEALSGHGYACSIFYSSFFDYTGFGDFLRERRIEEMYDADTMPCPRRSEKVSWGLREEETLDAIRGQIQNYAKQDRRFFLTYIPAAPHYPYDCVPARFHHFPQGEIGDYTPAYLNELLYMDWVLASILDQLKASGLLDKTLVVITDDHGESLGNKGETIGHGWTITPELANVPLIILDPAKPGYQVNHTFGSEVDLLPTILDLLRLPVPSGQLYQGQSLYAAARPSDRAIYVNSYQQYGVLVGNQFRGGDRQTSDRLLAGAGRLGYTISNEGSRSIYTENKAELLKPPAIHAFDEFQEEFLRNYSLYQSALAQKPHSTEGLVHASR